MKIYAKTSIEDKLAQIEIEHDRLINLVSLLDVARSDFIKNKLTMAEFNDIGFRLQDLSKDNYAETISFKVKEWFENHNANVKSKGIGWEITY